MEDLSMDDNPVETILKRKLARYHLLRADKLKLEKEMDAVKAEALSYVKNGRVNSAGSEVFDFKEPLSVDGKKYTGIQNTRKVSRSLNEARVLEWLAKEYRPYHDDVVRTVQHIDFDVLWNLYVLDVLDKETLDSFFDEKVVWAFTSLAD